MTFEDDISIVPFQDRIMLIMELAKENLLNAYEARKYLGLPDTPEGE